MKYNKEVSSELRGILLADLERYTSEVRMTEEEYAALCMWVQEGNSPHDNGWYMSTEDGYPMDFVAAMRENAGNIFENIK